MTHFHTLVLGAGPGGYVAAIRAAQLGLSVGIVEEKYWGGVCLNVGCIPSKALLRNAEIAHILTHEQKTFGISGDVTMDFGVAHSRSRSVAETSAKGVHYLLKKNSITEIEGRGTLTGPTSIDVKTADGTQALTFDNLVIATGATVRLVPGVEVSTNVVTYEEQILDAHLPQSIIIGGSGAIGVEMAYVLKNFGVDVTIVEFLDRIVPTEDADVSKELFRQYKKLGVTMLLSTAVKGVEDTGDGVRVTVAPAGGGDEQVLTTDRFLAAFGFAPRTAGYGLDTTGVQLTERGAIAVDNHGRTNIPHIFAIGDVTGKLMLAHTAEAMGVVAAEAIAGEHPHEIDFDFIPRATFCQPQIGSIGWSEAQAIEKGYEVKTAQFPFAANGKARGMGETAGFVKIVADANTKEILGAHLIGPEVTEMLPQISLAHAWNATAEDMTRHITAHPTLNEAVKEAIEGIAGQMINL